MESREIPARNRREKSYHILTELINENLPQVITLREKAETARRSDIDAGERLKVERVTGAYPSFA